MSAATRISAWSTALANGWRWCVDPVCSVDGKPSHPKLVTWAMLLMIACGREIPVVTVIALTASSYGLKAFLMFLQHNTSTAASTDATTRTIAESREPSLRDDHRDD